MSFPPSPQIFPVSHIASTSLVSILTRIRLSSALSDAILVPVPILVPIPVSAIALVSVPALVPVPILVSILISDTALISVPASIPVPIT